MQRSMITQIYTKCL